MWYLFFSIYYGGNKQGTMSCVEKHNGITKCNIVHSFQFVKKITTKQYDLIDWKKEGRKTNLSSQREHSSITL
jgi:hypothetical protein